MRDPKIFVTSDLHFGHKNVIEYCKRPFKDIAEMEAMMVQAWNDTVAWFDTVYILGDFAFCSKTQAQAILSRLQGKKIFVWGNHDRGRESAYLEVPGVLAGHDMLRIKHKGKSVVMTHYPFESFREDYHLHGHTHGQSGTKMGRCDVGVDAWLMMDYCPIDIDEVLLYIDDRDSTLGLTRERY